MADMDISDCLGIVENFEKDRGVCCLAFLPLLSIRGLPLWTFISR